MFSESVARDENKSGDTRRRVRGRTVGLRIKKHYYRLEEGRIPNNFLSIVQELLDMQKHLEFDGEITCS